MKLHDLTKGQRFEFIDKYRGKTFEVDYASNHTIIYHDVATGARRSTYSNREMFRKEVYPITEDKVVTLSKREIQLIIEALHDKYKRECEIGATEELKTEINNVYKKLK